MNLIDKIYKLNAKVWHKRFFFMGMTYGELHHIFFGSKCKVDISKCCLRLFARGEPGHHDKEHGQWVNDLRKAHKEDYEKAKANYVEGKGCKEPIFPQCKYCSMPKLWLTKLK